MNKTPIALLISLALIQGCSNTIGDPLKENQDKQEDLSQYLKDEFTHEMSQYSYSDDYYVLGGAFVTKKEAPLPPVFDMTANIGQLDDVPLEIILEKLNIRYQKFGVVATIANDADEFLKNKTQSQKTTDSAPSDDSTGTSPIIPIQQISASQIVEKNTSRYNYSMSINLKNTSLRNMLDLIAANTGLWWQYRNGKVTFHYLTEKSIALDIGDQSYQLTTSNDGQASYSLTTSSDSESPLQGIEKQIAQYLTKDGSVALNKYDRSITVKDTPDSVERIETFVKDFNYRSMTPYSIKAEVYEVIWEKTDNKEIDWEIAFTESALKLTGLAPPVVSDGTSGGLSATRVGGKFDGSKLMANFINKNSSIYSKIKNTVKTKNSIPAQLISSEDRAIVAGRSVTIDSNGFSQETIDTKILNEGFNIISRPRLTSTGLIDMEVIVNTSTIKDIKTFGTDKDQLQLEEMKRHSTMGTLPLRSGETAIINAYERDLSSGDIAALTEDFPWWTGGGNNKRRYKASLIVLVTPTILER